MSLLEEALKQHIQRQVRLGVVKSPQIAKSIKSPPIIPKQNYHVPAGYRLVKIKKRGRKLNDQELLILNRLVREACGQTNIAKKNLINSSSRQMAKERFKIYALAMKEGVRRSAMARYFKKQFSVINYGIQQMGEK